MTREQRKQMKGYIIPKPDYYDRNDKNGWTMKVSMLRTCSKMIGTDALIDIVEDTILEVYAQCIENDRYYGPYMFARTVKTYYMRKLYKSRGLTARGTKPKQDRYYIANVYDEEGENIIDSNGQNDDWYNELCEGGDDE